MPFGPLKTVTVKAGLRASCLTATALFKGPMSGARFRTHVEEILVPAFERSDTVAIDNLPAYKVSGIRVRSEAADARLLNLPDD